MSAIDLAADLARRFEGCRLAAYRDVVGVLTIGYGHTNGVTEGMRIDEAEAVAFLDADLVIADRAVGKLIAAPLADCQRAALIDFVLNLGAGRLRASTLRAKINRGEIEAASEEFPKWCMAGGRKLPGLVLRRAAERALYLS